MLYVLYGHQVKSTRTIACFISCPSPGHTHVLPLLHANRSKQATHTGSAKLIVSMLAAMLHVPPLLAPLPVTSVRASILRASASDVDQALINREIAKTIEYLNELDSEALPSLRETIEELQLAKRCLQERTPTGYADGAVPPVALPSPPKVTRTYGADSAFAGTWSPSLLAPIFQSAVLLPKKGTLLVVAAFQKVIRTALTIAVLLGAVMLQVATVLQDAMLQIAIQIATAGATFGSYLPPFSGALLAWLAIRRSLVLASYEHSALLAVFVASSVVQMLKPARAVAATPVLFLVLLGVLPGPLRLLMAADPPMALTATMSWAGAFLQLPFDMFSLAVVNGMVAVTRALSI